MQQREALWRASCLHLSLCNIRARGEGEGEGEGEVEGSDCEGSTNRDACVRRVRCASRESAELSGAG